MKQPKLSSQRARRLATRLPGAAAALLCLALLAASPASANFEQVANFAGTPGVLQIMGDTETDTEQAARWPEEVQLGGVSGMAVNYTGAGGVPKGTIYAATAPQGRDFVARYNPDGSFSERWTFRAALGGAPIGRCGPEGDPAQPTCQSSPTSAINSVDVDINQTTGNVYFYSASGYPTGTKLIHVYTPDGSKLLAEFGEQAKGGESIATSPGKLHDGGGSRSGQIAVNAAGDVYVYDEQNNVSHRLAKFEPQSPGDYEHYVYAGQGHDLQTGSNAETEPPEMPVFDAAGDIFVASQTGSFAKLDPAHPGAPPLCEFSFPKQGIQMITVDPLSDELFFYTYKEKGTIHRLSGECVEGKLHEAGTITFSPIREGTVGLHALAFDPTREYGSGRPPGVLYAGAPSGFGGKTEKNEKGETLRESALGYIFSQPPEIPPVIEAQSVARVTATSAELSAQVNPKGSATRYVFQYETEAQYEANPPGERFIGAVEAPPGGAFAAEGTKGVTVAASLIGLEPDAAYRVRVVASSHCSQIEPGKVCETEGEAFALRTYPRQTPGLPDHRAYELVSPTDKQGGQVLPAAPLINSCDGSCKPGAAAEQIPIQSAPDGNAVVFEGTPFDSEVSAPVEDQYLARRDPQKGWQTANLTPTELTLGSSAGYKAFSADLSRGLLYQPGTTLSPEAPAEFRNLYSQPSADPLALRPLLGFEPPNRPASGAGFFEIRYAGASADLSRIFFEANDALTPETAFAPEAVDGGPSKFNLYEFHEGQLSLVNVMPGNAATQPAALGTALAAPSAHPISEDGSIAFFSDGSGQVYVREDGEVASEISTEGTPDPGKFRIAATDGSAVLLANGHLHYLGGKEETVDLTEGKGGFEGVVGESEDLSRIYFVDTKVLDETPNEAGEEAEEGKNNLYAWAEGQGTRFVARLLSGDSQNSSLGGGFAAYEISDWVSTPALRTAEASANGRYLAFLSKTPLTGYDNTGPACKVEHSPPNSPGPCPEAFIYDSATGQLRCASCNLSGQRPLGYAVLRRIQAGAGLPQPRYLSDSGRLLFDSEDSLVPADTNEGIEDVYEYEPSGVGTCERVQGCISLISAGTGTVDSNLLATDPNGQNVFFTTRDQLTLKDKDQLIDLYDAREDGGIPSETEVARVECQGEACQPPISAPNDPTPGSSSFEGAGNVDEKKATKKHKKKHAKKHKAKKHTHKRAVKRNHGGAK